MIRILHLIGSLNYGGAETFLMNLYRNIDRNNIQFDFAVYGYDQEHSYKDEIECLGGKIFLLHPKKEGIIGNLVQIKNIVKNGNYKIVWRHTDTAIQSIDLVAAKAAGADTLILHAHSTFCRGILKYLHYFCRPIGHMISTKRYACGNAAGRWMFGKHSFEIIHNGIDVSQFCFDISVREKYRKQMACENSLVLGHIGRFDKVKNHIFLIDIFEALLQKNSNAVLFLIGTGETQKDIYERVCEKDLTERVKFLGAREDIPQLLQMLDIFVLPSLYEGLPLTLVEAQAADLPCVVSDVVSQEAQITGNIKFVKLSEPIDVWIYNILAATVTMRMNNMVSLQARGYDMKDLAKKIEQKFI